MALTQEQPIGITCIKYLLCISNFLFIMTALLVISVGTTIYAFYSNFEIFLEDKFFSPAALLIAIGFIILVISMFGFVGAIKESTCIIMLFSGLLGLVLILEFSAAIAAYCLQDDLTGVISVKMENVMYSYKDNNESAEAVDFLQERLNCCGFQYFSDWTKYGTGNRSVLTAYDQSVGSVDVPVSCCMNPNFVKPSTCVVRNDGCLNRLTLLINQSAIMLGTGAITIAFVQFLGIIFSCMLGKSIRRAKTEREMRRWEIRNQLVNNGADTNYTQLARGDVKGPTPVMYTASSTDA